jgi:hypothetical protein
MEVPFLLPGGGPFRFLPDSVGVEPSRGTGVELVSDIWSIESVGLRPLVPFGVGAGEGASEEGVEGSLGTGMPAISASWSLGTRSMMIFCCFFAIAAGIQVEVDIKGLWCRRNDADVCWAIT